MAQASSSGSSSNQSSGPQKVIVIVGGAPQIYTPNPGQTAAQAAAGSGVTDPSLYQEFPESDFDAACYNFPGAFSLENGVVSFNLDKAKQIADSIVNAQSNEAAKATLAGLSYDVYIAQSSLPAGERIAKYQAAIDANNAIALETEQREQAIYAATTIEEVNAIVFPDKAS
jgi:hypothetical protein